MKVELTEDWCMNMAKIEARADELHEGCQMPLEQARELAASEMSEHKKALLAAFGAAAAAREQDLRGQYPKAARVLAEEVFSLRAALRQKQAEYDDMKSLLLGNARNLHIEGERAREVLHRMLEAPTTQISATWKDAARQGLAGNHKGADARKHCTCDGAGRGPGRECVVKAGGRLGDLWRCADGLGA